MASGFIAVSTNNQYISGGVSWDSTVDIPNNRSTVTATLRLSRTNTGFTTSTRGSFTMTINGEAATFNNNGSSFVFTHNSNTFCVSHTVVVPHNADGTRSITISVSSSVSMFALSPNPTSGTAVLVTIPRASSITSFPNFTIEAGTVTISISRHSDSFTHNLTFSVGGTTILTVNGVGTSYVFTVAQQDAIYARIPNSTTATVTLTCQTISGTTNIGSPVTASAIATVAASIVPDFTTITHSENVANVNTQVGVYVQSLTRLNLAITGAVGTKHSTISSHRITVLGVNYDSQSAVSNILTSSGTVTLTGVVTDSRGRTRTRTVNVTVHAYAVPVISGFSLFRANSDGTANQLGTHARITRSGSISSINAQNRWIFRIFARERGAASWGVVRAEQTGLVGTTSMSGTNTLSGFAITIAYDFRLEFIDRFNTTVSLILMSTGEVVMSWGRTGVGIGKIWETGGVDIRGAITASSLSGSEIHLNLLSGVRSTRLFYRDSDCDFGIFHENSAGLRTTRFGIQGTGDVVINPHSMLTVHGHLMARGLSASWAVTDSIRTGAINAEMGAGSGATWIWSGTSGGVFRTGLQALDSNGICRLYSNGNFVLFNGATITGAMSVSVTPGNGLSGSAYNGSAAQTFALGTPSTCTSVTTNSVTATSHTHVITGFVTEGLVNSITEFRTASASAHGISIRNTPSGTDGATENNVTIGPSVHHRAYLGNSALAFWRGFANQWTNTSSMKEKTHIHAFSDEECLCSFRDLGIKAYKMRKDLAEKANDERETIGLIAEEAPDIVRDESGLGVMLYPYISLVAKAAQIMDLEIQQLKKEIEYLKNGRTQ